MSREIHVIAEGKVKCPIGIIFSFHSKSLSLRPITKNIKQNHIIEQKHII